MKLQSIYTLYKLTLRESTEDLLILDQPKNDRWVVIWVSFIKIIELFIVDSFLHTTELSIREYLFIESTSAHSKVYFFKKKSSINIFN